MPSLINPSNIDALYPIAGQDNDSQGFRDNFNNIKNNLEIAATEVSDIQSKAILKSALSNTVLDNDMVYNKITHAQLTAFSEKYHDNGGLTAGAQVVDYDNGNFQKITVGGSIILNLGSGTHWPPAGQLGKLTLWFNVANIAYTVTFPSTCTLGFPDSLANSTVNLDGTITITFPAAGDYFYDFKTVDSGVSIVVSGNQVAAPVFWTDVIDRPANVSAFTNNVGYITNANIIPVANIVIDAAQPNITSVGTLSSLTVSGPINGNISGSATSALTATTAGTVTVAAQPAITSVGTLSSLAVSGFVTMSGGLSQSAQIITPADGPSVQFSGNVTTVIIAAMSNIATLTTYMPAAPLSNQTLTVAFNANVDALTMVANVGTIVDPFTSTSIGTCATWMYHTASNFWFKIGN